MKKFKNLEVKKSNLSSIKGGTSTTLYVVIGYSETEYEDVNGDGKLDEKEAEKGKIVNF